MPVEIWKCPYRPTHISNRERLKGLQAYQQLRFDALELVC